MKTINVTCGVRVRKFIAYNNGLLNIKIVPYDKDKVSWLKMAHENYVIIEMYDPFIFTDGWDDFLHAVIMKKLQEKKLTKIFGGTLLLK